MMSVNIANALSKQKGIESFLCATRVEGALKSKLSLEINYLFLNKKSTLDILAIFKLKRYIQEHKISIVHAHSSSYFITTLIKLMNPKLRLIWHDHFGNRLNFSKKEIFPLRFCSNYFSAVIGVNKKLKDWSDKNLKTKQVYYIPNFASLSDSKNKTSLKGNEGKRIVCLAGFRPQKDHINLLKAFIIISKKHPDWTLHLVGNHNSDIYFNDVKTCIQFNNLNNSVFLYHQATDVKNILSQSDIGVLSSKSEGLPVSLLEYGLAKLPVVITDVGECANVVSNGKYGFVVPREEEKILAQKMEELVLNENSRKDLGDNFCNHINENYSEQKIIHKLLKIYIP